MMVRLMITSTIPIECNHSPEDELHVEEWNRIMDTLQHNVQCEVERWAESVIAPISPSARINTKVRWTMQPNTIFDMPNEVQPGESE